MDEPPQKSHRQSKPVPRCQDCSIPRSEFRIVHYFLINKLIRRICTNCVLKNSLGGFCPVCFEVYEEDSIAPPPDHERVTCSKCPSISHKSCISPRLDSTYLCPLCSDRNFAFFSLGHSEAGRTVDCKSSTALRAAVELAVQSMSKAVDEARVVADLTIQRAVIAKKEAIHACLAFLELQKKERKESGDRKSNKDYADLADEADDSMAISDTNVCAVSKADDAGFAEELTEMLEFDSKADNLNGGDAGFAEELTELLEFDSKADNLNGGDAGFAEELTELLEFDSKAENVNGGDAGFAEELTEMLELELESDLKADNLYGGDAGFAEELTEMLEFDSKADNLNGGDAGFAEELTEMLEFDSKADNLNGGDAGFAEELTEMLELEYDSKADTNNRDDDVSNADSESNGDAGFAEELVKILDSD